MKQLLDLSTPLALCVRQSVIKWIQVWSHIWHSEVHYSSAQLLVPQAVSTDYPFVFRCIRTEWGCRSVRWVFPLSSRSPNRRPLRDRSAGKYSNSFISQVGTRKYERDAMGFYLFTLPNCATMPYIRVLVLCQKLRRLGCVIRRPGSLWLRGPSSRNLVLTFFGISVL